MVAMTLAADPRRSFPEADVLEGQLGKLYERLAAIAASYPAGTPIHDDQGCLTPMGRFFALEIAGFPPTVQTAYWFACERELARMCGIERVTLRLIYTR